MSKKIFVLGLSISLVAITSASHAKKMALPQIPVS